jgi:diguanylate cyclase (GGDEF)-like protein/PAS domain S-box-containing protein
MSEKKRSLDEEKYQSLFEKSMDWIYIHDFKGNFLDANPAALNGLGYTKDEIASIRITSLIDKKQIPKAFRTLLELRKTGTQDKITEFKIKKKDGGFVCVETKAAVIYQDGKPYAVQGIARNITKRKQIESRLRLIFESSPTAIWYEDVSEVKIMLDELKSNGVDDIKTYLNEHLDFVITAAKKIRILDVNPAALKLWDADSCESLRALDRKFTDEELNTFKNQLVSLAEGKAVFEEETTGKTFSGRTIHYIIRTAVPDMIHYKNVLVNETDITRRKEMETALEEANKKLSVLARTDSLTGLLNHGSFMQRLREELSRGQRENHPISLIMADIDFFKHVNDKYGHPAGDRILADTALAIQSACRDYDIVGRYGGEEFAVILPNTTAEKAAVIAERMRKKVAENIHSWEGNDIQISVSLGTASSEDTPEIELKSLVKKADDALLEAKKKGRDQVVVWTGNAA